MKSESKTSRVFTILWCLLFCIAFIVGLVFGYRLSFAFADDTATPSASATTETITEVSTFAELVSAVNADTPNIKLMADINHTVPRELPDDHRLIFDGNIAYTLDLNGHKIYVENVNNEYYNGLISFIKVTGTSKLTIENGDICFRNYEANNRSEHYGNIQLKDSAELVTKNHASILSGDAGKALALEDQSKATLNGGMVSAMNGFAVYAMDNSTLTLDYGVTLRSAGGGGVPTLLTDGYGSLYFISKGDLTINDAYLKSGVQIHKSQIDQFDITKKKVVIAETTITSALPEGDNNTPEGTLYRWHIGFNEDMRSLIVNGGGANFAFEVFVTDTEIKFPITVIKGVAKIDGNIVTEASYGDIVTLEADPAETDYEFTYWSGNIVTENATLATTTFRMGYGSVQVTANYGKERVHNIAITMTEPQIGDPFGKTVTTISDTANCTALIWHVVENADTSTLVSNELFSQGKTYRVILHVSPTGEWLFDDDLTATINGNSAKVSFETEGFAYISYEFQPLASSFNVYYTNSFIAGQNSTLSIDVEKMADEYETFMMAYLSGNVEYQWYKNGEAINGATGESYKVTSAETGDLFQVCVIAGGEISCGIVKEYSEKLIGEIVLTMDNPVVGQKGSEFEARLVSAGYTMEIVQWDKMKGDSSYESFSKNDEFFFEHGVVYRLRISVYCPDGYSFVAPIAQADGRKTETTDRSAFAIVDITFETLVGEFDVITSKNLMEVGETLSLDISAMKTANSYFSTAYDAGKVTYQWYVGGVAIDGATTADLKITTEYAGKYIQALVAADGKSSPSTTVYVSTVVTSLDITIPDVVENLLNYNLSGSFEKDGKVTVGKITWYHGSKVVSQFTLGESYMAIVEIELADGLKFGTTSTLVNNIKINGVVILQILDTNSTDNSKLYLQTDHYICKAHVHTYEKNIYKNDLNNHWLECDTKGCPDISGSKKDIQPHSVETPATCLSSAICICGRSFGPLGSHSFGEWIDEVPATCASEGVEAHKDCIYCEKHFSENGGQFVDMVIPKNDEHIKATELSKDESGHWYVCTRDGCKDGGKIAFAPHKKSAEEATETADIHCTVCGFIIEAVKSHEHGLKLILGYGNTCTKDGAMAYYVCSDGDYPCGKYYEDSEAKKEILAGSLENWKKIPASHNFGDWVSGSLANCAVNGEVAHKTCSVCNKHFDDKDVEIIDIVIPKNDDHIVTDAVTLISDQYGHWHACTREGCKNNGKADYEEHTKSAEESTETNDIHCTVCNFVIEPIKGHVHELNKVDGFAETCTKDGAKTYYVCSNGDHPCGKYFEDAEAKTEITASQLNAWKTITAHHTFGEWIDEIPATVDNNGVKGHKDCSVCNKHFDADGNELEGIQIDKLGSSDDIGKDDPITPDKPTVEENDGSLSGGAIAGIVVGCVAVVGLGGFALVWFVIKKKKFADLIVIFKNMFTKK